MEKVLDIYHEKYDEKRPLICMDEASKQIISDLNPDLPMTPGQPRREDHHYERKGVRQLFMFFNPLKGWRRVSSRLSRTRFDWAEEVKILLDVDYRHAEKVTLVCDNLNTHDIASLYHTFEAEIAGQLRERLQLVFTPINGSWLNMAEIELSILSRQCLGNRRFATTEKLDAAVLEWESNRNKLGYGTNWRFTTSDARTKLKRLYPLPDIYR